MLKYYFYIVFCLFSLRTGAQNNYEAVSEKFIRFYNQEMPDSLYNIYSSSLKEKLPLEKTRAVISGLHVQFGELRSLELLKQDSGFNMYKAGFAHQTLTLLLALSPDDLIDGYRLVPYNKEQIPGQKTKDTKN